MRKILLSFVIALLSICSFGQMVRTKEVYKEHWWSIGTQYYKYVPKNFTPRGVVLFMHGIGERGTDISFVERNPLPLYLGVDGVRAGVEIPFIVIAPQETLNDEWNGRALEVVKIAQSFGLPIHQCGLSLGSMKVPEVINALGYNPFTTVATVCGKLNEFTNTFAELKKIPTLHYYGTADNTIANGYLSVKLLAGKLKAAGADCTYVEYVGDGHSIWNKAYDPKASNGYINWLLSKTGLPPVVEPVKDPIIEIYLLNGKLTYKSASGLVFN